MTEPRTLVSHPELRSHQSFPHFRTIGEAPRSALERVLSFFADVRAGEGGSVLLLTVTVFLLLANYYLLKTARESLILSIDRGAELKAYSSAAQAVLLLAVVPAYGWLRVPRVPLIGISTAILALNLLVFAAFHAAGTIVAVPFYIWLGIYNVFTVSQFWSFTNDVYTEGQGRRLFAFIGVGMSLGAWIGAEAAATLVKRTSADPGTLMIAAAVMLAVCFGLIVIVNRREVSRTDPIGQRQNEEPIGGPNGFALVFGDRYLLLIAGLMVLLNVVNSTGEFLLGKLVSTQAMAMFGGDGMAAERQRFIGGFYGTFFGRVNLLGFLLQLFVTSRLLRYMGVRGALFVLPVIALLNYSVIVVAPVLAVVSVLKVLENATDYSVQNTVKQALFLPTSREAKYKAKAAIDTFFMRLGDVMQAGIVGLGTRLGAGVGGFAAFTVGLSVVWLMVAGQIAREHRRRTV